MIEYAYLSTLKNFIEEQKCTLVSRIESGFVEAYKVKPSQSEINTWQNSLPKLQRVLRVLPSELDNIRVFIELRMPLSSARADVFLLGKKLDTL